jgi:hypothetical protein
MALLDRAQPGAVCCQSCRPPSHNNCVPLALLSAAPAQPVSVAATAAATAVAQQQVVPQLQLSMLMSANCNVTR